MTTVRKTVSMPEKVHEAAQRKMQEYGYGEFSDYIQALIRADTGVQPLRESAHPTPAGQSPAEPVTYSKKRKPKLSSSESAAAKKIAEAVRTEADRETHPAPPQSTQPKPEK